jgi:uncharacterized membrane protein YbhN (UPF0104 family)
MLDVILFIFLFGINIYFAPLLAETFDVALFILLCGINIYLAPIAANRLFEIWRKRYERKERENQRTNHDD